VIVRVATEGQYRLDDEQAAKLNELDNELVSVVQSGDEEAFRRLFNEMLELARSGAELGEEELEESDVILPPPDISVEEAREEFTGEGLIPG
jgi:PspAA-like protein